MFEDIVSDGQSMTMACERCRLQKKRCDRLLPVCGLCQKKAGECVYNPYRLERVKLAGGARCTQMGVSCSLGAPEQYPVEFRWYMPRLLGYYYEGVGVSRVEVDRRSTAYKLKSVWMQHAFSDPCLFHATLYTGSSYFDIVRGQSPSAITIYHQNEVIRLVNERLSDPVWALDDRTIASVCPLAAYANLTGNQAGSRIHAAGLRKIVRLKGGIDNLGLDGVVGTLIHTSEMVQSIAYDLQSELIPQGYHVVPPLGLESRILGACTKDLVSAASSHAMINLLQEIYDFKRDITLHRDTCIMTGGQQSTPSLFFEDPIFCCCHLAVSIFWLLMDDQAFSRPTSTQLRTLVMQLKAALASTADEMWLESNPTIHIWVCMAGAAAATETMTRIWFYIRQSSTMRVINTFDDFAFLDDIWLHFYWLRERRFRMVVGDH